MSSIVLDLQNEVTKPDCDIVNILRKAHLIAAKLNLFEFDKWILCELNGYKSSDAIPDYRMIRGTLKALNPYSGWIPTMIPDAELESTICNAALSNSISEIVTLCAQSEKGLVYGFSGERLQVLNNLFESAMPMQYALHLSGASVSDIVEKVKNTVLEWTIKLESEGILGEGMQFNPAEKETAKHIPQTINNYYGNTNVINAPVEQSAVVAGNENTVEFIYEQARKAASEIESALESETLSTEDQEIATEILAEIKEKIAEEKKPSIIKSALIGLKDFLIGVGASATVAVIQAKIQGLF